MGSSSYTYEAPTGFHRFNSNYSTCNQNQLYSNFFDGIFTRFKDTFFFANLLQFGLVSLMYYNVGKGKYWKILFYSSLCGLFGSIFEAGTIAFLCTESRKDKPYVNVFTFFIAEFFWIGNEYSIPLLNLIKMRAFSKGKAAKIITYTVLGIFPLFAICRFWIGYIRTKYGVLNSFDISNSHGVAFACMAIADLICTCAILYFVKKNNQKEFNTSNINHYIKRSSYVILLCVDVISILLAIICFLPTYISWIPNSITLPLHCVKSAFILILASDALLFKYEVNSSSLQNSSTNNISYAANKSRTNFSSVDNSIMKNNRSIDNPILKNNNNINNTSSNNKSQINSNNNTMVNVAPFNFSNMNINDAYQPKSIIKNYTGIRTPVAATIYDLSEDTEITGYPHFGMLQQPTYENFNNYNAYSDYIDFNDYDDSLNIAKSPKKINY